MKNRISHSAINVYSQCGKKYYFQYKKRLRSKVIGGALLFGSALDKGLNTLLQTRDIKKAHLSFSEVWEYQYINDVKTQLPCATNVVYAEKDYDADLISDEDEQLFQGFKVVHKIETDQTLKQQVAFYRNLKKEIGFAAFSENQKKVYNFGHWLCLRHKGRILIDAYNQEVMPKIKEVLAVQKPISLENAEGDEITGYLDLILRWEDDKIYVADNKSSTKIYEEDSAGKSQQLILYYHSEKEAYGINGGAMFFVLQKQIDKNKKKICMACGFDGSETRHKTCNNTVSGERCEGIWKETIDPKGKINIVCNEVSEAAENLVLETFDKNNEGIKKEVYAPNLSACGSFDSDYRCPYYDLCWKGKDEELLVLPERKK